MSNPEIMGKEASLTGRRRICLKDFYMAHGEKAFSFGVSYQEYSWRDSSVVFVNDLNKLHFMPDRLLEEYFREPKSE
jgi:hypothetical protein